MYLASGSPRRLALLQQLGLQPQPLPSTIDETPLPQEAPQAYTERMAWEKSRHALNHLHRQGLPEAPIVSADTSVVHRQSILGKPTNHTDAATMLHSLSGSSHQVISAVCVWHQDRLHTATSVSTVRFKALSTAEIAAYVATGEPMDKAGAYGIQGFGGLFVAHLSGSFTGVMGLPLFETAQLLQDCGIDCLSLAAAC